MSARLERLRAWFDGRTRRERLLLAVMAVLLGAALVWYGLVTPVQAWCDAAAERRAAAAAALASVEADIARIEEARETDRGGGGEPIEPLLLRTAAQAGLGLARHQAESDGAHTVWLEAAPPEVVFGWIATLERGHGVSVTNLTALKAAAGGLDVQVSFRQAAP